MDYESLLIILDGIEKLRKECICYKGQISEESFLTHTRLYNLYSLLNTKELKSLIEKHLVLLKYDRRSYPTLQKSFQKSSK